MQDKKSGNEQSQAFADETLCSTETAIQTLNVRIPDQGFNHFDSHQTCSNKCVCSTLSFDQKKKKKKNMERRGEREPQIIHKISKEH